MIQRLKQKLALYLAVRWLGVTHWHIHVMHGREVISGSVLGGRKGWTALATLLNTGTYPDSVKVTCTEVK